MMSVDVAPWLDLNQKSVTAWLIVVKKNESLLARDGFDFGINTESPTMANDIRGLGWPGLPGARTSLGIHHARKTLFTGRSGGGPSGEITIRV